MYQYLNVHPKGLIVGDCVKRAITTAAQMDYMEVQRELNRYKKITGAQSFNSDYNPHRYVENVLHARKLSFPARRGQKRMTAGNFSALHPTGRYILNMAGHWSCCVNGVIYDTWDCSDRCVYTAYEIPSQVEPVPVPDVNHYQVREESNGTVTILVYNTKHSLSKSANMSRSLSKGYCKCLNDLGYTNLSITT